MFARLLLAEFVVADLTLANANVFYEFGIRHAAKPFTTVPILANVSALPFDVALVRAVTYQLENGKLTETSAQQLQSQLAKRLRAAIDGVAVNDSPLFQLIPNFPGIDLPDDVTETFKDRLQYVEEFRQVLVSARSQPTREEKRDALLKIQGDLGDLKVVPRSVLIELMFSFRDAEALKEVERLVPLVSFAVARRGGASSSDYWDLATVLELACIGEDWATAARVLPKAILAATDSFKTATTIGNLRLLKQARGGTGRDITELD